MSARLQSNELRQRLNLTSPMFPMRASIGPSRDRDIRSVLTLVAEEVGADNALPVGDASSLANPRVTPANTSVSSRSPGVSNIEVAEGTLLF